MLVIEVEPGAVDWERLTACQVDARAGLYAQAMAGYLRWLARWGDDLPEMVRQQVAEARSR